MYQMHGTLPSWVQQAFFFFPQPGMPSRHVSISRLSSTPGKMQTMLQRCPTKSTFWHSHDSLDKLFTNRKRNYMLHRSTPSLQPAYGWLCPHPRSLKMSETLRVCCLLASAAAARGCPPGSLAFPETSERALALGTGGASLAQSWDFWVV